MKIVLCGLIGGMLGYNIGAYASCMWLWPEMNLCGLTGALITGPIGVVIGAVAGWRLRRSQK